MSHMSVEVHSESDELVIVNVRGGKVTRKTFNGQSYLVAPMTLLQAGKVLDGSQGPLLYPAEEVSKDPGIWNNTPITLGHPVGNDGKPTWARIPEILERYQLGHVFNDSWNGQSRDAEGWFNEAWTKAKAPDVYKLLTENKSFDLSTGLKTDNYAVRNGSQAHGKIYTHVARNYRPDHLAVLPNQTGACSRTDGCGVLIGNENMTVTNEEKRSLWRQLGDILGITTENGFCPTGKDGGQDNSCSSKEGAGGGKNDGSHQMGRYLSPDEAKGNAKSGDTPFIVRDKTGKTVGLAHDEKFADAEAKKHGGKYEISKWKKVKKTVTNQQPDDEDIELEDLTTNQGDDMATKKEELVSFLTTNCSCYKGKEKTLNLLDEDTLNTIKNRENEAVQNGLVVNALRETIPDFKDLAVNAFPAAIAAKKPMAAAPAAAPCPECGGVGTDCTCKKVPAVNKLAPANERLTPEEQETLAYAKKLIKNSHAQLVTNVVNALAKDENARKALRPTFEKHTHEDLEGLLANMKIPTQTTKSPTDELLQFFGGVSGGTNNSVVVQNNAEPDPNNILAPTTNWAAEEAKAAAKASASA